MMKLRFPNWRAALAVTTFGAAALLAACGGGGGDAGTSPLGTATDVTYAQGAIAGLGSIIVNGVRFDDSGATVEDEDGNRLDDPRQLKMGMMVQVDAGAVTPGTTTTPGTAVARRVRFGNEIVGPIGIVDVAAKTVVVLGQTVLINESTWFDDSSLSGGLTALAALPAGSAIEVHGILNQTTLQITATRIEAKPNATSYRLRGVVSDLKPDKTFKIGSELISYATLAAADLPSNLKDGVVVRTQLALAKDATNGAWVATKLRSGVRAAEGRREAEVEGTITAFTSPTSFEINGLEVVASGAATVFFPADKSGIVLGARVEVEGSIVDSKLIATKVKVEDEHRSGRVEREFHGLVGTLDPVAKTFVVRGVTVSYANATFRGGVAADLAKIPAPRVEVKGTLNATGTGIDAIRISFEN
ncbi:conserved exported hypothetical protein [Rubrivivax sp. A210]|uniref:DUF5666 domain-containing protein n=1 Tax=Rubrivivax sp. A210 TaxID=2772301 RepID=UPI001991A3C4|nr:DUF5666 domain-containing protein [Rubrivivax sp. A210]CAD5372366.1 conserved exported hypothetical protein [Rubrivivax sp. A210]